MRDKTPSYRCSSAMAYQQCTCASAHELRLCMHAHPGQWPVTYAHKARCCRCRSACPAVTLDRAEDEPEDADFAYLTWPPTSRLTLATNSHSVKG